MYVYTKELKKMMRKHIKKNKFIFYLLEKCMIININHLNNIIKT